VGVVFLCGLGGGGGGGGLLPDLHCESLELLLLMVRLQGNIIKMSFAGSRDHIVCSPLRTGSLPVPVVARSEVWFCPACLLRLWVRIQLEAWMSFCSECCVLSVGDLWNELIIRLLNSTDCCGSLCVT